MDAHVVTFYREIFADLSIDRDEAAELTDFLSNLNPPPDKITWLRAQVSHFMWFRTNLSRSNTLQAFRVGSEHLTDDGDMNVSLLRTINFLVHAIETTCLEHKELENGAPMDEEAVTSLLKSLYDDLSIDQEENEELFSFFRERAPPDADSLVPMRALAFKIGCDYLSDDNDANVALLRCINCVVHAFELTCLKPRPYELQIQEDVVEGLAGMSLSEAVQHVWNVDANRLDPNADYQLNVQGGKKPYWKEDGAPDPLFTSVDRSVWKRPTYAAFCELLDNYVAATGEAENVTDAEREEVKNFLDCIMQTGPMQFCHKYCQVKDPDNVPEGRTEFMQLLHKIWFELYRRGRGRRLDSSGFEHVFVGEVRDDKISGMHNWIQLYLEEQRGEFDYRGYIKPKGASDDDAVTDGNDHLLTLQFRWHGVEKFVGTSFIGVSPEFEMALYTMCFLVGEEENEVQLQTLTDEFGVKIKCYRYHGNHIGTSFPEVTSHFD